MLPRLGGSTLTWIRAHRYWQAGHCLQYVRNAFDVESKYPSAISAWNNAQHKHHEDTSPPPAVPVFFAGGRYGHVATSCGGGYCYSTDAVEYGRVDKVSIVALSKKWAYPVLGWTEDLNGVRVYTVPVVDLSSVVAAVKAGGTVAGGKRVKAALAAEVGRGLMSTSDSRLGWRFRRRYKKWQRSLGYAGAKADSIPGKASLSELGRRHGFQVKD